MIPGSPTDPPFDWAIAAPSGADISQATVEANVFIPGDVESHSEAPLWSSLIPRKLSAPERNAEPVRARSLVQCPDLGPDPRSHLQADKAFHYCRLQAPALMSFGTPGEPVRSARLWSPCSPSNAHTNFYF